MGDFDKELEDYLSARRRPGLKNVQEAITGLFSPKEKKVKIPEEVQVYESKETKGPLLKRVFGKKEEEITNAEARAEEAIGDMKEIAKIALLAIKQLSDDQLTLFKKGPEFERLKEILKKNSLIK